MSTAAEDAIQTIQAISPATFGEDELARLAAIAETKKLLARLQTPSERAWAQIMEFPTVFASTQTLRDVGLWDAWTAAGGGEKTLDELVQLCHANVEPGLLRRLLRLLTATNVVEEVGQDRFLPTAYSTSLGGEIGMIIQFGTDHLLDAGLALPPFLKKTGYKESEESSNTAYSHMASNPEHYEFFQRCQAYPRLYDSFSTFMANWTGRKPNWTDAMDLEPLLLQGTDVDHGSANGSGATPPPAPLLVDMGGHYGVDLQRLLDKYPQLPPGSLVLQDLPEVAAAARRRVDTQRISVMDFDLFKAQPVHHSRVYFIHAVLHNWPDKALLDIFSNIRPAMKMGYSKLLICDMVMAPTGASSIQGVMDVQMMALLAAKERTQAEWDSLLAQSGFANMRYHQDKWGMECIIEADPA